MKATVRELESKLLRTSGDKERLEVLLELARAHAAEFQNREGLRASREALSIARRLKNSIGVGQALSRVVEMLDKAPALLVLAGGRPLSVMTRTDVLTFLSPSAPDPA